jgi:hypothetical protein
MKQIKWTFVAYAVLAASSIMGIGVAIGETSVIGAVISTAAFIVFMGLGFKTKRKMRNNGEL